MSDQRINMLINDLGSLMFGSSLNSHMDWRENSRGHVWKVTLLELAGEDVLAERGELHSCLQLWGKEAGLNVGGFLTAIFNFVCHCACLGTRCMGCTVLPLSKSPFCGRPGVWAHGGPHCASGPTVRCGGSNKKELRLEAPRAVSKRSREAEVRQPVSDRWEIEHHHSSSLPTTIPLLAGNLRRPSCINHHSTVTSIPSFSQRRRRASGELQRWTRQRSKNR